MLRLLTFLFLILSFTFGGITRMTPQQYKWMPWLAMLIFGFGFVICIFEQFTSEKSQPPEDPTSSREA